MLVAVSGGFDPLHEGHIEYVRLAHQLGEHLVCIMARDDQLIAKKGYFYQPLHERIRAIESTLPGLVWQYAINIDTDTSCACTLAMIKPALFAKGGDRTRENIPLSELQVCIAIGCKVVFGLGNKLQSSSHIVDTVVALPTRNEVESLGAVIDEIRRVTLGGSHTDSRQ